MSIANVNSTSIGSTPTQSSSRGFQRVGSTSGTSSFTPTQNAAPSSSTSSTSSTSQTQPNGQQPKSFKGRGQLLNIVV